MNASAAAGVRPDAATVRRASKLSQVGTTIFTVMSQRAAEVGAVNLGQGFPDFSPPEALQAALAEAVREGQNQYAPMIGIAPLREAIADGIERAHGIARDPAAEITVTVGGSEAIFDAILALIGAGDEVVVLDPAYDLYAPVVTLAGGWPVRVPLAVTAEAGFVIDWDRVTTAVTPRTRLVIVNSPHNPTGAMWSAADADQLATLAEAHDLLVMSDEVYAPIVFDGRSHVSALAHEGLAPRSLVVSSFGKSFHCTGWRLGAVVAPPALTQELRKVHQYNTFGAFAPAQWAVARMLRDHPAHLEALGAFYQAKRDQFAAGLARTRFRPLPVAGGYFQCVDYSAVSEADDLAFVYELCDRHGVAAIPLSPFYGAPPEGQRVIRLCFAKETATLDTALARLAAV
jgi:methionine aminotransferase